METQKTNKLGQNQSDQIYPSREIKSVQTNCVLFSIVFSMKLILNKRSIESRTIQGGMTKKKTQSWKG